jgi:hypothetical protein
MTVNNSALREPIRYVIRKARKLTELFSCYNCQSKIPFKRYYPVKSHLGGVVKGKKYCINCIKNT